MGMMYEEIIANTTYVYSIRWNNNNLPWEYRSWMCKVYVWG